MDECKPLEGGTRDALEAFFRECDTDGDRSLTLEEFLAHFGSGDETRPSGEGTAGEHGAAAAVQPRRQVSVEAKPRLEAGAYTGPSFGTT